MPIESSAEGFTNAQSVEGENLVTLWRQQTRNPWMGRTRGGGRIPPIPICSSFCHHHHQHHRHPLHSFLGASPPRIIDPGNGQNWFSESAAEKEEEEEEQGMRCREQVIVDSMHVTRTHGAVSSSYGEFSYRTLVNGASCKVTALKF